ncbi:hypothetical protein HDU97_001982 [Phlyctochytrium planicorne]|nr:hypothetical protein HDU97_001982 [Phlyctochytrium planicorne]
MTGGIPDFQSLTNLETLDLRNNLFDGPIPESLSQQRSHGRLKSIYLDTNCFTSVPSGLTDLAITRANNCPAAQEPTNGNPNPGPTPNNPNSPPSSNPTPQNPNPPVSNQNPNSVTSAASNPTNTNAASQANLVEPASTEDVVSTRLFTISGTVFTSLQTERMTRTRTTKPTTDSQPGSPNDSTVGERINIAPIVGSAVGTLVVCVVGILLAVFVIRKRRKLKADKENGDYQNSKKVVLARRRPDSQLASTSTPPALEDSTGHDEVFSSLEDGEGLETETVPAHGHIVTFSSPLTLPLHGEMENNQLMTKTENENESKDDSEDDDGHENLVGHGRLDEFSIQRNGGAEGRLALSPGHLMLSWTVSDVERWLDSIGIRDTVIHIFVEQEIDGPKVALLSDHDLEHDLGIESRHARAALLRSIREAIRHPHPALRTEEHRGGDGPPGIEDGEQGDAEQPPPYAG